MCLNRIYSEFALNSIFCQLEITIQISSGFRRVKKTLLLTIQMLKYAEKKATEKSLILMENAHRSENEDIRCIPLFKIILNSLSILYDDFCFYGYASGATFSQNANAKFVIKS